MDNIIRPTFGAPRPEPQRPEPRIQVTTERVYGEAHGYRVCLVRGDDAPEGDVLKVAVGLTTGMEVSTVAILPATEAGETDAELVALAVLRALSLVEVETVPPRGA
ncbi:hypothetical protein ASG40_01510 [Methylobacterium sp. Leaf399]|uniref:hypothetical protein n=1 Tax=unclassified Methylobacterium TaxID=2615210 RepID=UPI0006F29D95|nr:MULTISPECIES: hypothetical protein [unclassified Methylobacterium]KQP61395.1 hypothetical protein ASF39_01515 [Methylobacterium sp. Leaf108]KQT19544.1 hypothetical protein ASG40_01510 [Methylobacterium sp. Leaf399]KQT80597.1 hypothetical protein ASG59_03945 [Methylobacterium sp. Leaf466]